MAAIEQEAEMRERQRQYLDFLDDDVSSDVRCDMQLILLSAYSI